MKYSIILPLLTFSSLLVATQQPHSKELTTQFQLFKDTDREIPLVPISKQKKSIPTTTTTTTTTTPSLEALINAADEAINKKYSQNAIFDFFNAMQLSKENMINIFTIVSGYCQDKKTTVDLSLALYNKNSFFKESVHVCTQEALQNIYSVTPNTIDCIENPESAQPPSIFQSISPLLKTFIMNCAQKQISCNYALILICTDEVLCFHVCPTINYAVTASKDNKISLWDLNTATNTMTVRAHTPAYLICFNKTGTHIATASHLQNGSTILKQWKIGQSILERTHHSVIDKALIHLAYSDNNSVVATDKGKKSNYSEKKYCQMFFKFKKNGDTSLKKSIERALTAQEKKDRKYVHRFAFNEAVYLIDLFWPNMHALTVTKHGCYNLYLCEQAIENAQSPESLKDDIEKSKTYQELLTEYEKRMVLQQIQKKVADLIAAQQLRIAVETQLFQFNFFS